VTDEEIVDVPRRDRARPDELAGGRHVLAEATEHPQMVANRRVAGAPVPPLKLHERVEGLLPLGRQRAVAVVRTSR
jgi:hypothetical protein